MKKVILFIVFALGILCPSFAQLLDNSSYNQDVQRFNATVNKKKDKHASAIYNLNFHDENANIAYQCVIPIEDPSYLSTVIACTKLWFKSEDGMVLTKDASRTESVQTIKGLCHLGILASHNEGLTYGKLQMIKEHIHANAEVVFEFKEDRLRMSIYVKKYVTSYTVVGNDVLPDKYQDQYEYSISSRPPFKDSTYKKSWLSAYIEANANCLRLVGNYINYVNKSYVNLMNSKKEDERRSNDNW